MPRRRRRSSGLALVAALAVAVPVALGSIVPVLVPAVAAAAPDFPAADAGYHNYPELVAAIHEVEAAHPELVDVFSIGKSAEGRDIWAAKVSDNVAADEDEPEVLVDALHHGDEHLAAEQALYLLHVLAGDDGIDEQVTALVDAREVWIVFMLNPDGAQYDLTGDPYRGWRKSRQRHPSSSSVGTDLNRNYDYRWGCCGGSSGSPASRNYRGWRPFSAPESRALADFVNSRVVGGRQQIRTHASLHANGELILWPYAYTTVDVPGDMTAADRSTFWQMANAMAATNGYTARQSGDWYISDGDLIDWLYGRHRIFSFTVELYPPTGSGPNSHSPPDELIQRETSRNRAALLYLIDLADCPYRASGTATANCGPMYDDLELGRGWTRNPFGDDTATSGTWARGDPGRTASRGVKQLGKAFSGSRAFVTGVAAASSAAANDLDGRTSILSRAVALPADPAAYGPLTFRWYLAHSAASGAGDLLRVFVVDAATGHRTKVFERLGRAADVDAWWRTASVSLEAFAGRTIRLLFVARDGSPGNLVEAGLDDIRIQGPG
ncbi:MAG TPA: M14 family metallopeptidase [Candidatus Binatia bacterium]|nr:M14 family metallopeptidase [Candidatus Binatia bacterium]